VASSALRIYTETHQHCNDAAAARAHLPGEAHAAAQSFPPIESSAVTIEGT